MNDETQWSYMVGCGTLWQPNGHSNSYKHGCQNHNLEHRIALFYDLNSPKHLGSY